jgi:hypothetical protein
MDQHLHLEASLQLAAAVAVEAIASMALKAVLAVALPEEEPVVQLAATQRHLVGQVSKTAEQVVLMVAVAVQAVQVHQLEEALVSLRLEFVWQAAAAVGDISVLKIV